MRWAGSATSSIDKYIHLRGAVLISTRTRSAVIAVQLRRRVLVVRPRNRTSRWFSQCACASYPLCARFLWRELGGSVVSDGQVGAVWPQTPDPRCTPNSESAPDLVRLVWLFSHALWRGLQTPLPDWDTARPWRKRKGYKRVSLRNKNPWADCTLVPLGVRARTPSVTSALPPHRAFGLTLQRQLMLS